MTDRRDTPPGASLTSAGLPAEVSLAAEALSVLHANGAESGRTQTRTRQLAAALRRPLTLDLGWNRSELSEVPAGGSAIVRATPAGIGMNRVLAVDHVIDALSAGRISPAAARDAIGRAASLPPAHFALFALACALGASCLAVIFGVTRWEPVVVIAVSAVAGAAIRRLLGKAGASNFWQVGAAAVMAGLLGAVAVNAGFSSDLRLAVVCPCMILVPGPHLLNAAFDIAALRIPLGLSRLAFAAMTLLAIGAGLILGLTLGGATLVAEPAAREIPLAVDAVAAGLVAVCYGVFYSAPLRILFWPLLVGAVVHAVRWIALTVLHVESWVAAGLASFLVGVILIPISRRFGVPFAAVGFASIVSLMPGVLIFRALDGLAVLQGLQGPAATQLLVETVQNANAAWLTLFALAVGILLPAAWYDRLENRRRAS